MKLRVYIETTVPSCLAARPSRDLIVAAHQQVTHEWWNRRRPEFEVYISTAVIDECSAGDPEFAAKRLELLREIPVLAVTESVIELADQLMRRAGLPSRARFDAVHVAAAVCHRMNFLISWNCKHIANATLLPGFDEVCRQFGHILPVVCTPELLLEESSHD